MCKAIKERKNMRKLELLIPAGSLDVLKTAVQFISAERRLDCGQRRRILRTKRSKRALRSPMSAASKYILQQIFLHIMMI